MKNEREIYDKTELMQHRRIHLSDGRYLIFYTFDPSLSIDSSNADQTPRPQPENKEAEEKKNV
jgi:hypothetical protein